MRTGGRYLERALDVLLPLDIGKVKFETVLMGVEISPRVHDDWGQSILTIEEAYHLHYVIHTIDIEIVHHCSFAGVLCR